MKIETNKIKVEISIKELVVLLYLLKILVMG